jgi:hypothetical protein
MSYSIESIDADENGQISVKLVDFAGTGSAVSSGKKLYYKVKGTHVYN